MTRILIVGGGYAGFYTALGLERELAPGEAQVTLCLLYTSDAADE